MPLAPPPMLVEEAARGHARGWRYTPLAGKRPTLDAWTSRPPASLEETLAWAAQGNLGVRTGPASGVVVIDIDAGKTPFTPDDYPATVTARTGGGGWHLYYALPAGETIGNSPKVWGLPLGIDIRGDGGQVVAVGSIHPDTGNLYTWMEGRSPDEIALAPFPLRRRSALAPPPPPPAISPAAPPPRGATMGVREAAWAAKALQSELTALSGAMEGTRNHALNTAAFNLGQLIGGGYLERGEVEQSLLGTAANIGLPEAEARKTISSGITSGMRKPRLAPPERMGAPAPGTKAADVGNAGGVGGLPNKAADGRWIISAKLPAPTARAFCDELYRTDEARTLHNYTDVFCAWRRGAYQMMESGGIRKSLYRWLETRCVVWEDDVLVPCAPNKSKVDNILDALKAEVFQPATTPVPCVLNGAELPPVDELLACPNGVLHIPAGNVLPATPNLFTFNAIDFDYRIDAPKPTVWLSFLDQLWGDDPESIMCFQEILGYLLLPDTRFQKIFMLVGPPRSGKGTLAHVTTAVVGENNVCSPTLASFGSNFGLSAFIGKSLAIVPDARLSGKNDQSAIAERLLSISGEDSLLIDRKNKELVTMRLATRIMILTNETPMLADSSGALASRFIVLATTTSFLGREDLLLKSKLQPELSGILLWALEGRERLYERGHFFQPASGKETMRELESLASPISVFVDECCMLGEMYTVPVPTLFEAWRNWCDANGRHPGSSTSFGRQLRSYAMRVTVDQRGTGASRWREYRGIMLSAVGGGA